MSHSSFPSDYSKHRLSSNKELDKKIDALQAFFSEIDPDFSNLLQLSLSNPGLRILFKVVLDNNLMVPHFLDETERKRLTKEITVILHSEDINVLDYFLVYEDLANFYIEKNKIANFGRGNSVSSFLNYLLGVTKINPIKHGLMFDRFMDEKTGPQLSFDCPNSLIAAEHLSKKYGSQFYRVSIESEYKISTALDESMEELNFKRLNFNQRKGLSDIFKRYASAMPRFKEKDLFDHVIKMEREVALFFKLKPELTASVREKLGKTRCFNLHPCTFVILKKGIKLSKNDFVYTEHQGNKIKTIKLSSVNKKNLFKIDLLGNIGIRSLNSSVPLSELKKVNLNDNKIFERLCDAQNPYEFNFSKNFTTYNKYRRESFKVNSLEDIAFLEGSFVVGQLLLVEDPFKDLDLKFNVQSLLVGSAGRLVFQEDWITIVSLLGCFSLKESVGILKKKAFSEKQREQFIKNAGSDGEKAFDVCFGSMMLTFLKAHAMSLAYLNYYLCCFNLKCKMSNLS